MRMLSRRTPALVAVFGLLRRARLGRDRRLPAGAAPQTFQVTSTDLCGGAGTFMQALADANANPGYDTIAFDPGRQVEAWTCNSLVGDDPRLPAHRHRRVDIVGNGVDDLGGQVFAARPVR